MTHISIIHQNRQKIQSALEREKNTDHSLQNSEKINTSEKKLIQKELEILKSLHHTIDEQRSKIREKVGFLYGITTYLGVNIFMTFSFVALILFLKGETPSIIEALQFFLGSAIIFYPIVFLNKWELNLSLSEIANFKENSKPTSLETYILKKTAKKEIFDSHMTSIVFNHKKEIVYKSFLNDLVKIAHHYPEKNKEFFNKYQKISIKKDEYYEWIYDREMIDLIREFYND